MKDDDEKTVIELKTRGNFRKLYNKKYGDIVQLNAGNKLTPEQIFELCVKYFHWAEDNAIKAAESAAFQGVVSESLVHKTRIFTIRGLCLFCGFSNASVLRWRSEPGFSDVMEFVDNVIYEQKFQLAANGVINAGFIGKDLGIDKPAEINVNNENNSVANIDTEQFKDAVKDILGAL